MAENINGNGIEIEKQIFEFIKEKFNIGDDPDYTPEINLFDYGFVDSLGATVIITFAEENWNIEISQRDLTLYPMNSVNEISAVVRSKL